MFNDQQVQATLKNVPDPQLMQMGQNPIAPTTPMDVQSEIARRSQLRSGAQAAGQPPNPMGAQPIGQPPTQDQGLGSIPPSPTMGGMKEGGIVPVEFPTTREGWHSALTGELARREKLAKGGIVQHFYEGKLVEDSGVSDVLTRYFAKPKKNPKNVGDYFNSPSELIDENFNAPSELIDENKAYQKQKFPDFMNPASATLAQPVVAAPVGNEGASPAVLASFASLQKPFSPTGSDDLITTLSKKHGLDPNIARAIMRTENSGPNAVSRKGAQGSMQVMPSVVKQYMGIDSSAASPEQRIEAGIKKLADDHKFTGGDPIATSVAYFGGRDGLKAWREGRGTTIDDGSDGKRGTNLNEYAERFGSKFARLPSAAGSVEDRFAEVQAPWPNGKRPGADQQGIMAALADNQPPASSAGAESVSFDRPSGGIDPLAGVGGSSSDRLQRIRENVALMKELNGESSATKIGAELAKMKEDQTSPWQMGILGAMGKAMTPGYDPHGRVKPFMQNLGEAMGSGIGAGVAQNTANDADRLKITAEQLRMAQLEDAAKRTNTSEAIKLEHEAVLSEKAVKVAEANLALQTNRFDHMDKAQATAIVEAQRKQAEDLHYKGLALAAKAGDEAYKQLNPGEIFDPVKKLQAKNDAADWAYFSITGKHLPQYTGASNSEPPVSNIRKV